MKEIAYFKAEGNLVYLYTHANDCFIADFSLEEISDSLDPNEFFRINRTYLTQINAIREIRKYFNSRLKLFLFPAPSADEEIVVSRNRVHSFLNWLGN